VTLQQEMPETQKSPAYRENPFISIIMPVWNRAEMIPASIDSVLNQTFQDYELLIVDDGSEDGLEDVVAPFLGEKCQYFRIPHQGVGAARNYGLQLSRGEFIAYLDSDNVWHPQFLFRMYRALDGKREKKRVAYCRFNIYTKDDKGKIIFDSHGGGKFSYKKLLRRNTIDLNTLVHAKDCLKTTGEFDKKLRRLNDWDFILRLTSAYKPIYISDVLVDYFFCVADNAITQIENRFLPDIIIRERYMKYSKSVEIYHDSIAYKWKNVPHEKFINWAKMADPKMDTSNFQADGFPYMLQIEPTNICNLSCALCPAAAGKTELNRPRRHMKLEEFQAIVDDMDRFLLFLVMWTWGEPLTNPQLPQMLRYAHDKDIKTVTSTNAHFLGDHNFVEEILQSGLSTLIVAIDSVDEENYNVYRKKGDLQKCLTGLENLMRMKAKLRSKTLINLRMVVMKQNAHEIDAVRELGRKLKVDVFSVKTVNPSCGRLSSADHEIVPENPNFRRYQYKEGTFERVRTDIPCSRIWHMSNILSNGDVVPCCFDYAAEMKVGNVFDRPFSEIWNDPQYRELRRRIYLEKETIHKCWECDINFKLSENGWFIESEKYVRSLSTRLLKTSKEWIKTVLPERAVERIRSLKRGNVYREIPKS
jgi:radical SAM protein with 4Fe4S-binding SPASM domain